LAGLVGLDLVGNSIGKTAAVALRTRFGERARL
jgi:hypothetical protein